MQAEEIGIVLAASTAIRILAGPVLGHAADRLRRHSLMLCACALAAAIASLGYVTIRGFSELLIVALVHAAMLAPVVPISDALATTAAQESAAQGRRRFEYGWLRASGSAAFVLGTVLIGWRSDRAGLACIIWISALLLVAGGATALLLPGLGGSLGPIWQNSSVRAPRLVSVAENSSISSHPSYRRIDRGEPCAERHVCHNPLACSRCQLADHQHALVGSGVVGGAGLPIDWTMADSSDKSRWRMCSGSRGRGYSLVSLGLHSVTNPAGACPAVARRDICAAALGVHARDCAGGPDSVWQRRRNRSTAHCVSDWLLHC